MRERFTRSFYSKADPSRPCGVEGIRPNGHGLVSAGAPNGRPKVPWLAENSPLLVEYVSAVMNSPIDVRDSANALIANLEAHPEFANDSETTKQIALLRSSLDHENMLLSGAGGTVVSKLIEEILIQQSRDWVLESSGASDYPDLFIRSDDYSELPVFRRGADQVYGAALKGKSKRAVRVPDGLEISLFRRICG